MTPPVAPVVGFDLDMTLADTRAGIVATLRQTLAEQGFSISDEAAWALVGIPLDDTVRSLAPGADVPVAVARYRELYPSLGVPAATPLPGAAEALAAVRAVGGRAVVVSAKVRPAVDLVLEACGLAVDPADIHGGAFAEQKAPALLAAGATAMVGDHPGDLAAARAAGVVAVGVTTGPHDAAALREAGADVVWAGLEQFDTWLSDHVLDLRLLSLDEQLTSLGSVLVAFSGGADSAFLLAAAVRALGPANVVAATAVSPSLARGELAGARTFAESLGVRLVSPRTHELDREGYRANGGDRCAFCKTELVDTLLPIAEEAGLACVITGTNADDARAGFRPGIAAAAERGARTPLLDAGLTKDEVRRASRRWGLPTWDKPAAACLSSRIAYGIRITPGALARVDRAEKAARAALAGVGVAVVNLRVRDLGDDRARLEVDPEALASLHGEGVREAVTEAVTGSGFSTVDVDPRGFRSGSMNELLPDPERYR